MTVEPKFCGCCKKARTAEGKPPRMRQPVFLVSTTKALDPVFICDFCDGDALRLAQSKEQGGQLNQGNPGE